MENQVKRTERGWAGHYILADRCSFCRNTLLEYKDQKVVVSTVGRMNHVLGIGIVPISCNRHFETRAFMSCGNKRDDIDSSKPVFFKSECNLPEPDMELEANEMHENVVKEITGYLLAGTLKYGEEYL